VKKLKGDYFIYSANRLKDGKVVFLCIREKKTIWNESSKNALKIKRNEIELYENQVNSDERNCIIIGPYLVEIKENGEIIKLREKIRSNGLNINYKENV
jgi:hypothetical protein